MTDDAPTPDGTRNNKDAVAAPQAADARTSTPEDISHVLSATTPDTAAEPRPENGGADDDDAESGEPESGPTADAVAESVEPQPAAEPADAGPVEADKDAESESADGENSAPEPDEAEAPVPDSDDARASEETEVSAGESDTIELEAVESQPGPADGEDPCPEPSVGESADADPEDPESGPTADAVAESVEPQPAAEPDEAELTTDAPAAEPDEAGPADGGDSAPVPDEAAEDSEEEPEAAESGDSEAGAEQAEDAAPEPDDETEASSKKSEPVESEASEAGAEPVEEDPGADEPAEPVEEDPEAVEDAESGAADIATTPVAETLAAMSARTPAEAEPTDDAAVEPESADGAADESAEAEDSAPEPDEAEDSEEEPEAAESGDSEAGAEQAEDAAPEPDDETEASSKKSEPAESEASEAGAEQAEDAAPGPDDETETDEPAGPADEPTEPEPVDGTAEDAESGAADIATTPVAETLAAMSARTPAEAEPTDDAAVEPESADGAADESAEAEDSAPEPDEAEDSEEEPEAAESGDSEAGAEQAEDAAPEPDDETEASSKKSEPAESEASEAGAEQAEDAAPGPDDETETDEPAGPADEPTEPEPVDGTAEDAESGAVDVATTPVAETLAAMSARTPAEAVVTETLETGASGPRASAASAETAAGAPAAEAPSDSASTAAAGSVPARIRTILVRTREALAELLHGRRPSRGVLAGIIGAGLLVLVWGGAAVATTQHIFAGSTVSGIDVGDMSPDEARQLVADQVGAELAQPVVLSVNDSTDTLVPAESGVTVDAAASINRLIGPTINPVTIIKRLSGTDVGAVTAVDSGELTNALNARLGTLATGTADAVVTLEGATPVVTPGANGTGMDVDASVKALSAGWPLGQAEITLVEGTARPAITDDDATTFVDSVLTPLLSDSLTVTAAGTTAEKTAAGKQVVLSPDQIADLTTISTDDGELSAVLDSQRLHDAIIDATGPIETEPTNAGWTIDGSAGGAAGARPQYVSPSPGEGIDMDALTQQLMDAGTTGTTSADRTVALTLITTQPEITTPEADWGIVEVTGEFATPFSSEPGRDQNLIRGAEQMNGQIVMPGETFSVEQALGPVDYEHGFTDAGVISNGQHVDALGGGLSQIGTTMFNVGFEAGMDDIEHHPHSYYFDRYPAGREATLWTGQKDVKFANSTPYAVLIQAWVADGEVHTRIWSTHYYDVSITSSDRYNYRPVQTITRPAGAGCQAYSGGNPGFDITVTRTRTAPDRAVPDDVLTTTYDADNNIACGGSGKSR